MSNHFRRCIFFCQMEIWETMILFLVVFPRHEFRGWCVSISKMVRFEEPPKKNQQKGRNPLEKTTKIRCAGIFCGIYHFFFWGGFEKKKMKKSSLIFNHLNLSWPSKRIQNRCFFPGLASPKRGLAHPFRGQRFRHHQRAGTHVSFGRGTEAAAA